VPVGLTGHREKLFSLRTHRRDEAATIVDWVEKTQEKLLQKTGSRLVFAADELYLKAERVFPPLETYEELAQIENGVGLIPLFRSQAQEALADVQSLNLPPVSLVTGESAAEELKVFVQKLAAKTGADLRLHVVENRFFGGQVTVSGLVVGKDMISQLQKEQLGRVLLVPDVMLREGEDVFIDDVRVGDLATALNVEVEMVPSTPWGIVDMLQTLAEEDWS